MTFEELSEWRMASSGAFDGLRVANSSHQSLTRWRVGNSYSAVIYPKAYAQWAKGFVEA